MFRFVGLCFGMLVRFFRERRSLLLGATRRAAPSLQSSGIVRIDFRPVLYICALYAHAGWPPPESSCSIEPITACLLHQEPPRLGSQLEFWRTTGGISKLLLSLELGRFMSVYSKYEKSEIAARRIAPAGMARPKG